MDTSVIKNGIGGVYCIRNIVTNKVYIGSSNNIRKRLNSHFSALKKQKHHNQHLQAAYNKYNGNKFEFEVLEEVKNEKDLTTRENFYIQIYRSYKNNLGFNLITDSVRGTLSEESRKKMSMSRKGKPHKVVFARSILQMSLSGEIISKFNSIAEAAQHFKCCRDVLNRACIDSKLMFGFKWQYGSERKVKRKSVIPSIETRLKLASALKNNNGRQSKPIIKLSLDGKILERYESAREAAKIYGSVYTIGDSCRDGKPRHGYKWMFASSNLADSYKKQLLEPPDFSNIKIVAVERPNGFPRSIVKVSLNGEILERYENATEAAKFNNTSKSSIRRACVNSKTVNNFKWAFASTPLLIS